MTLALVFVVIAAVVGYFWGESLGYDRGTAATEQRWSDAVRVKADHDASQPLRCRDDEHVFEAPDRRGRCRCGAWLIAVFAAEKRGGR